MHKPRKRFGQHFLIDETVIADIINAVAPSATDTFVEIGPGEGVLTTALLEHCENLSLIEFDRDLIPVLASLQTKYPQLAIHQADVLRFDFDTLAHKPYRVIGNLPYNISSQIIITLLAQIKHIVDMYFMIQKEMADRICALPGSKRFGRISVMVQYYCDTNALFNVAASSFNPPPKVNSTVITLKPKININNKAHDLTIFQKVVTAAFNQRRKQLANSLKAWIDKESLANLGIDPSLRAEALTVDDFVNISNTIVCDGSQ